VIDGRCRLSEYRVGTAVDAHRLVVGRPLVLGGMTLDHPSGLDGHSDADVVCHVLTDAMLGAAGIGDIGRLFPSTEEWKDAASIDLLRLAYAQVRERGWVLGNADCMVVAMEPKLAPHVDGMRARCAAALETTADRVSIRATGTDGLGFTGRGEGIAAHAVVLLERS
jgi:2-C-methyl-D-erythritol 2,4-cyclodiphosphate synthase